MSRSANCQPAMPLDRVLPVINLRTAFLDERIDRIPDSSSSSATGLAPHTARVDAASGSGLALPPDCRPRIGSGPPARDGASRAHPALRCTPGGCRRAGGAGAMRLARSWPGNSPRVSRLCHWQRWTRARSRKAFRTADRSPFASVRGSPARPGRRSSPRSTNDRRNVVSTCAFSVSSFDEAQDAFLPRQRNA